ncbi:hypothetical protein [Jannaschia pohangensis]|uniref:DUF4177 domain-containing protein n=1 Tax=Jannaschia pohangensis TaxID=390807 RepID=A0A1I3IP99_9RHOB|nr:hypothetical protein [Jannaschia pohangensis]SFI49794.1 hypothetical protein SAMN04488095_1050 [Jannaschia pohangensis]
MKHAAFPSDVAYEYEAVPAPTKAERRPGLKTDGERLAFALSEILNIMAEDGWDYIRSDTFSTESWTDVTGTAEKSQTILIFRRPLTYEAVPEIAPAPRAAAPNTPKPEAKPLLLTEPTLAPGTVNLPSDW